MTIITDWAPYAPYFTEAEFKCSHTGKCLMQARFLDTLLAIRKEFNLPMVINSGYRDATHPEETKKPPRQWPGPHVQGVAADIHCPDKAYRERLWQIAKRHGIRRFGFAKTYLHLDAGGEGLAATATWTYA